MEEYNVKTWLTNNGTRITRIATTEDKVETIKEINVEKYKTENAETYNQYVEEKEIIKKGKKGYVKITLPQGKYYGTIYNRTN